MFWSRFYFIQIDLFFGDLSPEFRTGYPLCKIFQKTNISLPLIRRRRRNNRLFGKFWVCTKWAVSYNTARLKFSTLSEELHFLYP